MKPTLLIDMDGIFCDFVAGFYQILETHYPSARKYFCDADQLVEFYIEDNLLDQKGLEVSELICDHPDVFGKAPPFPGAIEGMQRLLSMCKEANADVFICTAPHMTNLPCYSNKAEWVNDQLGIEWLKRLIITRDKTVVRGHVLLDDKPDPLGNGDPQWDHVLMTRSYNKNLEGRLRINGWEEDQLQMLLDHAIAKSMGERNEK